MTADVPFIPLTSVSPLKATTYAVALSLSIVKPVCLGLRQTFGEPNLGGVNTISGPTQVAGAPQINKHTNSQMNRNMLIRVEEKQLFGNFHHGIRHNSCSLGQQAGMKGK
jgi:hypothetical protein